MKALYWIRNDLRVNDNPALSAAVKAASDIIPLFILDEQSVRPLGGAQRWWLHHSLSDLAKTYEKKGAPLYLRRGDSATLLKHIVKEHKIESIYWNRVYEPDAIQRDAKLKHFFQNQDVSVHTFNASLLIEPSRIKNKSGDFFKVFTPYSRRAVESVQPHEHFVAPRKIKNNTKIKSDKLSGWELLPKYPDWSKGFKCWRVGEAAAKKALKDFIKNALHNYAQDRDRPDVSGTSLLSAHLHFGEISIFEVWENIKRIEVLSPDKRKSAEGFLRQLIWREFSYYLLFHFPDFCKKNFRAEFDKFKWKKNKKAFEAWKKGQTGYPIVDAGMRQLWQTGWMHNRVRMITASFLTKDLLIDWREGEEWFWDALVDADLANNAMGWQWVAGSGADAAPYFRIFNPTLQGIKFDSDGDYVRKWVPELSKLPSKYIHCPEDAPEDILNESGVVLGQNYPCPIVNHKAARESALKAYKDLK